MNGECDEDGILFDGEQGYDGRDLTWVLKMESITVMRCILHGYNATMRISQNRPKSK
jgi:hypothetical protein